MTLNYHFFKEEKNYCICTQCEYCEGRETFLGTFFASLLSD